MQPIDVWLVQAYLWLSNTPAALQHLVRGRIEPASAYVSTVVNSDYRRCGGNCRLCQE